MKDFELPTVGIEVEIWRKNYQLLHADPNPHRTFEQEVMEEKLSEVTKAGCAAGALAISTFDGGVYEIVSQPEADPKLLYPALVRMVRSGILPAYSRNRSSMHVNLAIPAESPSSFVPQPEWEGWSCYVCTRALRIAELLGATRPERLLAVETPAVSQVRHSQSADRPSIMDVGGWNCKGLLGCNFEQNPASSATQWIGSSARMEFRTLCYKDIASTISAAALIQAYVAGLMIYGLDMGTPTVQRDLVGLDTAIDAIFDDQALNIRLIDANQHAVDYNNLDAVRSYLKPNAQFLGARHTKKAYVELQKTVGKFVNIVRNYYRLNALRLVFSD